MLQARAEELRCGHCRKLLARGRGAEIQIKCPRCGTLNHLKTESLAPDRHRATDMETLDGRETCPPPASGGNVQTP